MKTDTNGIMFCLLSVLLEDGTRRPHASDRVICSPGAQPRLKSWGGPRFGSQHRDAGARARPNTGLGVGCGRGSPLPLWGSGGITPSKFLKTQMLNLAFWWLLAVKFLAFWKLRPRSCGGGEPIHRWSPT